MMRTYFIRDDRFPAIKIGCSHSPLERLDTLQTGNPQSLHLLGSIPGGLDLEATWHRKFSHLLIHGEWFHEDPELSSAIWGALSPESTPSTSDLPGYNFGTKTPPEVRGRILELHRQGVPRKQIAKRLTSEGIRGPNGGTWHTTSVGRVIDGRQT